MNVLIDAGTAVAVYSDHGEAETAVKAQRGPIVTAIVSALEGAALVGAIGALGAGLVGLGVPKN